MFDQLPQIAEHIQQYNPVQHFQDINPVRQFQDWAPRVVEIVRPRLGLSSFSS